MRRRRNAARPSSRRALGGALALAAMAGAARPMPAQAWWSGGVFFGGPYAMPYYGAPMLAPPAVVPPPYYYAPQYNAPPAYAPGPYGAPDEPYPPAAGAPAAPPPGSAAPGRTCFASAHICPLDPPGTPGQRCSCPANGSRVFGHVG